MQGRDAGASVNATGTQAFPNAVLSRGEPGAVAQPPTDYGSWAGSISFATSNITWHFGTTTTGLGSGEADFLSAATHELAHVLGFGTANSWKTFVSGGNFTGAKSVARFGSNVPLATGQGHWVDGAVDPPTGLETAMDPVILLDTRKLMTELDFAGLDDLGWEVSPIDLDLGDAPDSSYPTLLDQDGARHVVAPGGPRLGALIDTESNAQPNATATGDDASGSDDEDGVTFSGTLVPGQSTPLAVVSSATGFLDAWFDFNADGGWDDAGEQSLVNAPVVVGTNNLTVAVPADAAFGSTFSRFRLSSAGGLAPTGQASDGEVEDYQVTIQTVNRFDVNSNGDNGDASPGDGVGDDGGGNCTLRAAILEANALANSPAGADVITFNIAGPGPHAIAPLSALPAITDAVIIDGTSEPDFAGTPIVELNGSSAGAGVA